VGEPTRREDIRLEIEVGDTAPWVGEAVPFTLRLHLRTDLQGLELRLPGADDPDGAFRLLAPPEDPDRRPGNALALSAFGREVRAERSRSRIEGRMYTTLTIEQILVPRQPGRVEVGPALASCRILVERARGFFDRDRIETAVVPSSPIVLDVRPLPEEGRPANFTGLVGRFEIETSAEPRTARVGDPIELTVTIEGAEPLDRIPPPDLAAREDFAENFRVQPSGDPPATARGVVRHRYLIRPASDEVEVIPAVRLPHFDPEAGRYRVATSSAIPLDVRPTPTITGLDQAAAAAEDVAGTGEAPTPLRSLLRSLAANHAGPRLLEDHAFTLASAVRDPGTLAAIAVPPALWASLALAVWWRTRSADAAVQRRRRRRAAAGRARRALDDPAIDAVGVGRVLRTYAAERWGPDDLDDDAALTSDECVALVFRHHPQAADDIARVLARCDDARYGGMGSAETADALRDDARGAIERIERSGRDALPAATEART